MQFLLDTNVLSEAAHPQGSPRVDAWLRQRRPVDLAVSVLTLGEIRAGIARMPEGKRRRALDRWLAVEIAERFAGRLLAVTVEVAVAWGEITAEGQRQGRPVPVVDGLLLATAKVHHLTLVTRNLSDCEGRGVEVVDPWG